MKNLIWLCLILLWGCSAQGEVVHEGGTAVRPTRQPSQAVPTSTPAPPLYAEGGQNENGTFFRGSPDAPVTLADYSDFL